MNKEFNKLQKENQRLRDTIRDYIEEWGGDKNEIWIAINALIQNEIEQEGFCNG